MELDEIYKNESNDFILLFYYYNMNIYQFIIFKQKEK